MASRRVALLLAILVLAAALRLTRLGHSPPGLHVDEASNVWSSWCLWKTGRDAAGDKWPIFYTRSFGENRSALMLYALLPFEGAAGGPSVVAARAAAAAAGVAAVLCLFLVGRRFFDEPVGLAAAVLLAIAPWHVQASRWAHEANVSPLLVLAPLAALLAAGLPFADSPARPRAVAAGFAGALAGLACYGYPSVRILLPLVLAAAAAVSVSGLREPGKKRERVIAVAAAALGFLLVFGPLAFEHLLDPAIGKRGATTWVWETEDGLGARAAKVLARYPGHFGPDFLFQRGDPRIDLSPPPGHGLFQWWLAPLLVAGIVALVMRARRSRSARVALLFVALYPAGDLLNRNETMSLLRSLAGLPALVLVGSVGAVEIFRFVARRSRPAALAVTGAAVLAVSVSSVRFFSGFFGEYDRQWDKYFAFQKDLLAAVEWLRPRFEKSDSVVVTGVEMTHPYVYTLVGLRYDPARWLADQKTIVPGPLPDGSYAHEDVVARYGKVSFLFPGLPAPGPALAVARGEPAGRVVLILRPGELGLDRRRSPDLEVRSPRDEVVLQGFELEPGEEPRIGR